MDRVLNLIYLERSKLKRFILFQSKYLLLFIKWCNTNKKANSLLLLWTNWMSRTAYNHIYWCWSKYSRNCLYYTASKVTWSFILLKLVAVSWYYFQNQYEKSEYWYLYITITSSTSMRNQNKNLFYMLFNCFHNTRF